MSEIIMYTQYIIILYIMYSFKFKITDLQIHFWNTHINCTLILPCSFHIIVINADCKLQFITEL